MKNSVSCLNAKAIPIRKHLSLNLAVSQNCRLLMCSVLWSEQKESSREKIGKTPAITSKISANEIHGEIQVELNHKNEMNCA